MKLSRSTNLIPNTVTKALSLRQVSQYHTISLDNPKIEVLLPNSFDHFEIFSKIITDERIVFSSSWIDKWFKADLLRQKCNHTEMKLKLIEEGDNEILFPEEVMVAYRKGVSPKQIALDRFFSTRDNREKLRGIYKEITRRAEETGLGYYKFEDKDNNLLGGGALAPISDEIPVEKVDIALHILSPNRGLGSFFLDKLLKKAFDEHGIKQVWGSSIVQHQGTPTLCAKHGMIIENKNNMKHYFIDSDMWKLNKDRRNVMDNPIAASTYFDPDNKDKKNGGSGR